MKRKNVAVIAGVIAIAITAVSVAYPYLLTDVFSGFRSGYEVKVAGDFSPVELRRVREGFLHPEPYGNPFVYLTPAQGSRVLYISCSNRAAHVESEGAGPDRLVAELVAENGDTVRIMGVTQLPSGHFAISIPPIQPEACAYLDLRLSARGCRPSVIRIKDLPEVTTPSTDRSDSLSNGKASLRMSAYRASNKVHPHNPGVAFEVYASGLDPSLCWFWTEVAISKPSVPRSGDTEKSQFGMRQMPGDPLAVVIRMPFSSYQKRIGVRGVLKGFRGSYETLPREDEATAQAEIPFELATDVAERNDLAPSKFNEYEPGEYFFPRKLARLSRP